MATTPLTLRRVAAMVGHGLVYVGKALLVTVPILLILVIAFHDRIINNIYKNVGDLNDGEMPVTVTSYPSAPEIVGIAGGSGQGLNCSLPPFLDVLFDASADTKGNRHLVRQRFRQACVFHDLCYRHGLATYGYTQNDCDRILQNQAYRLCLYIPTANKDSQRCQRDAKKILAGVNLGGFGSYRGWDRSTFFEFDADPLRSIEFSYSRITDHPFKSLDPEKYRDDPKQVILSFINKRAYTTVRCVNCGNHSVLDSSDDSRNVSPEFKAAGIPVRPEALINRSLKLRDSRTVWLPGGHHHAAPHFVTNKEGEHQLVWMSRSDVENTGSCVVTTDTKQILTYTLPQTNACGPSSKSKLQLAEVEMYSSSPQPMVLSENNSSSGRVFATGLTVQRDKEQNLYFCGWSDRMRRAGGGDRADCKLLKENQEVIGKEIGAFQNMPIVRADQQLIFIRDIAANPTNAVSDFIERAWGNTYSPDGSLLVIDVAEEESGALGAVTIKKNTQFTIDDRYDPMVPLSRSKDDYRFLSVLSSKSDATLHITDFSQDTPQPKPVDTQLGGTKVQLHASWVLRPGLVVHTGDAAAPKTELILSRARIGASEENTTDSLQLETVVLERDASAAATAPFVINRAATCQVKYTFQKDTDRTCRRQFSAARPMRPSPAALLQASQSLVGRVTASNQLAVVFTDLCLSGHPLVLDSTPTGTLAATTASVEEQGLTREVQCDPLTSRERIEQELPGVGEIATGR